MADNRIPVDTLEELNVLDDHEMVEGYRDGLINFKCGDNRSKSYWHGWRNGMVDAGHAEADGAQRKLASAFIKRGQ